MGGRVRPDESTLVLHVPVRVVELKNDEIEVRDEPSSFDLDRDE